MARWRPDARERLERAAFALFAEQGFAETTVPQITARAGLTTRTFFRYFADKREVIFAGEEIPELAARLVRETPPDVDALTLITTQLQTVADSLFQDRRQEVGLVRRLIESDDGLRERDLRKRAALADAIRDGLIERGSATPHATLLAETTVTVLHVALDQWLDRDDGPLLRDLVLENLTALRTLLVG
jgi:AcrR family transcriptional regulator